MKLSSAVVTLLLGAGAISAFAIPDISSVGIPPPLNVDASLTVDPNTDEDLANVTKGLSKRNNYTTYTTGTALKNQMLQYHNAYRAHHGAQPVKWSSSLAKTALATAKKCVFAHSNPYKYGENLGGGSSGFNNPAYFVYLWYKEIADYDYKNPGYSDDTGHFTQVVWNATTTIGCAWVQGCTGSTQPITSNMLLCEYSPNGNILPNSNFAKNVAKPKSSPKLPATPKSSV